MVNKMMKVEETSIGTPKMPSRVMYMCPTMRWIYAGGVPYTPYDVEASEAVHRGVLDENLINSSRLPDYHSLNVRFDRRFFFQNTNIVFYLSIWNVYGRKNIGNYGWNEIENKQEASEQWSALPIFGIELEL